MKLKLVKGRFCEIYNTKDVKRGHKEEAKTDEKAEADQEQGAPVPLVTNVNIILLSISTNVEVHINNQKKTFQFQWTMRTDLIFATNSRGATLNMRGFCNASGTTLIKFSTNLWKRLCRNRFSQEEWKCLADPMASCCMVNWYLTFPPLLNCHIQIWKLIYD